MDPALLARQYADPVEVIRRDDQPSQFLWHRRRYLVRAVLDRWTVTGAWWDRPPHHAATGDDEYDVWRVEAAPSHRAAKEQGGAVAVMDLCFAWTTGRWSVQRVFD